MLMVNLSETRSVFDSMTTNKNDGQWITDEEKDLRSFVITAS